MLVKESIAFERNKDPKISLGLVNYHKFIPLLQKVIEWDKTYHKVPTGAPGIRSLLHKIKNDIQLDEMNIKELEWLQKYAVYKKLITSKEILPVR